MFVYLGQIEVKFLPEGVVDCPSSLTFLVSFVSVILCHKVVFLLNVQPVKEHGSYQADCT